MTKRESESRNNKLLRLRKRLNNRGPVPILGIVTFPYKKLCDLRIICRL